MALDIKIFEDLRKRHYSGEDYIISNEEFVYVMKKMVGELATSHESLEIGFFSIEAALEMVTWRNFKQRIEFCLNEERQPFYVEFSIPLKDC